MQFRRQTGHPLGTGNDAQRQEVSAAAVVVVAVAAVAVVAGAVVLAAAAAAADVAVDPAGFLDAGVPVSPAASSVAAVVVRAEP